MKKIKLILEVLTVLIRNSKYIDDRAIIRIRSVVGIEIFSAKRRYDSNHLPIDKDQLDRSNNYILLSK